MKLQYDGGQDVVIVYGLQVPVKAADVSFNLVSFLAIVQHVMTIVRLSLNCNVHVGTVCSDKI
jgi:hypothetical protein